jgi:ATP-dependent Clp protease protease subunit
MRNRIQRLFNLTAKAEGFFRLDTEAAEPTIYLYTIIGKGYDWETDQVVGVSDMEFVMALHECRNAANTHLRVNSPGGDVFHVKAMQTAMMNHPGNIVMHVDGIAASAAASLIPYADVTEMSVSAFLMIHKAMTWAGGNSDDHMEISSILNQFDESIAQEFCKKSGKEMAEILEIMKKDTYMDAKTAKEMGFCDSILEPEKKIQNKFDLSIYGEIPEPLRVVKPDAPAQARETEPFRCDRAVIERRLACIERIAA